MGLQHQIDRQTRKLVRAETETERLTRMLLFGIVQDMDISPTSRLGLLIIDNFRPSSTSKENFAPERITEWIAENFT